MYQSAAVIGGAKAEIKRVVNEVKMIKNNGPNSRLWAGRRTPSIKDESSSQMKAVFEKGMGVQPVERLSLGK